MNVVGLEIGDGAVHAIHSIVNPDKLAHLGPTSDIALRSSRGGAGAAGSGGAERR